uniref:Integrase core domain containing protein n=1 Tax=Solanum tuberosum TaxID=4113 RepID=M1DHR8_SOLTU
MSPRSWTVDQSMDRRQGPWMEALEKFTKCETTDVDYGSMAPKKLVTYTKMGKSKSVAPSFRLIDEDNNMETDPAYVPPNTRTSPTAPRVTRGTPEVSSTGVNLNVLIWGQEQRLAGSIAKSATCSDDNEHVASFDEATSSESVPAPQNDDPIPVAGEPNRWYAEGQWQIYRDAKMKNDKEKMARLITEEHRVLTRSLHTVPDIHRLFKIHKCDWMARDLGTYSEEIVREFYASYAATLRGSIDKRAKPTAQDPITSTMVRVRVADSTTDGVFLVDAGTTEGDPSVDLAGSGKSDPPAC